MQKNGIFIVLLLFGRNAYGLQSHLEKRNSPGGLKQATEKLRKSAAEEDLVGIRNALSQGAQLNAQMEPEHSSSIFDSIMNSPTLKSEAGFLDFLDEALKRGAKITPAVLEGAIKDNFVGNVRNAPAGSPEILLRLFKEDPNILAKDEKGLTGLDPISNFMFYTHKLSLCLAEVTDPKYIEELRSLKQRYEKRIAFYTQNDLHMFTHDELDNFNNCVQMVQGKIDELYEKIKSQKKGASLI